MKCIFCGNELTILINNKNAYRCDICKIEWTLVEHKDNQNWAVRHIRALEAQVKDLQEAILILQQKVT